jgi:hypothetical protein
VTADAAGNNAAQDSDTWQNFPTWLATSSSANWNGTTKTLTVIGASTIVGDPVADLPAVVGANVFAALTLNPPLATQVNIASLTLVNGATATMTSHGSSVPRPLVTNVTPAIDAASKLDLSNNVVVIRNGNINTTRTQLAAGFQAGAWTGVGGIISTAAAGDPTHSTSLGFASNASLNKTSFAGVTGLTSSSVMVKYTYAGDANLDGQVDIGDLGLLAGAWQQSGKSWFDGDFTYDGRIDIGDLGLLAGNWQKGVGNPL